MKCQVLAFLILAITFETFSQEIITGKVISVNGEAIPFATIHVKNSNNGTYANELGKFELILQHSKTDTLIFSSVGFSDYYISIQKFKNNNNIILKEFAHQLPEVIVSNKRNITEYLGARKDNSIFTFGNVNTSSTEIALFIENPYQEELTISTVNFFIKDLGEYKAPFRIRLYSNLGGLIGEDILNTSLIVSAKKTNAWLEINVLKYKMVMPKAGIFLSMEWLYGSNKKYFYEVRAKNNISDTNKKINTFYGQNIGLTDEFSRSISFVRSFKNSWKPYYFMFPTNFPEVYKKQKLNPMFKISVLR
jgi:hypothetical protein